MKFWRQSRNVTRKAAKKDVCKKKACEKTLMKLTIEKNNLSNGNIVAFDDNRILESGY
jgi:hypothetical protein